jgi:hypothetical protein
MGEYPQGWCRRGQFCVAKTDGVPAPAPDRPLCVRDEQEELPRVLRELPGFLACLRIDMLAPLPGRARSEWTAGREVMPPLPYRADLDEFATCLVATVVEWAWHVAHVARIKPPPPGRAKPGHALDVAVGILRPRVSVLLALRPITVMRRTTERPDGEAVTMDGGAAALELFDAHWQCRSKLGRTRRTRLLPYPCLACGVAALVLDPDTRPDVRCSSCGLVSDLDDHEGTVSA